MSGAAKHNFADIVGQFAIVLCCVGIFPAVFWGYMVLAVALGQTIRLSPVQI